MEEYKEIMRVIDEVLKNRGYLVELYQKKANTLEARVKELEQLVSMKEVELREFKDAVRKATSEVLEDGSPQKDIKSAYGI